MTKVNFCTLELNSQEPLFKVESNPLQHLYLNWDLNSAPLVMTPRQAQYWKKEICNLNICCFRTTTFNTFFFIMKENSTFFFSFLWIQNLADKANNVNNI